MRTHQCTLGGAFEVTGVGLHGGRSARVRVMPAPPGWGLRISMGEYPPSPLSVEAVVDTAWGTSMTVAGPAHQRVVHSVEHGLAALAGLGVDNATLAVVQGDELPAMDGSARPMVERILEVGVRAQPADRRYAVVRRPVSVARADGASVTLEPTALPELVGRYVFRSPVGEQTLSLPLTPATVERTLAPARTFGFAEDLADLRGRDKAAGGTLDNAVLFDVGGPRNPGGLRFTDECARHKLLDAIGDLAFLGAPLLGRYVADRGGHTLNVALVKKALATEAVVVGVPMPEHRID